MVQLRLYLKELKNFLSTVTIKDTMIADSMLTTWVRDEWQEIVANNPQANPYYRALMGDYIVFEHSKQLKAVVQDLYDDGKLFSVDRGKSVQDVLNALFPLTTRVKIEVPLSAYTDADGNTITSIYRDVPNKSLYRYSNEVPIVSSYDDTYKIPFAREFLYETGTGKALGLKVHSSTSAVYRIPNERYNTLVSRYPKSSSIIHSIVYPIPVDIADTSSLLRDDLNKRKMQKIENSDELAPLVYDPKLLEQQERQSIIDCMTNTLMMIKTRYQVRELGYENLYAPAHYYIIWQILFLAIFVQRILNIHTGDAHLYHIWNYLKSNGFEDYRDVLTLRQQKFLYKNLPYLLHHKGTQHAFEILNYVFFHTQNISLYGKNTIQTTENDGIATIDTTKKYPAVRSIQVGKTVLDGISKNFDRHARFEDILHYLGVHAGESSMNDSEEYHHGQIETLSSLYKKEKESGLEYQDDSLFERSTTRQTKLMSYSPISHRNTKLLELRNNNTSDYNQAVYTKFIGETLLYRLSRGELDFVVEIQLPESAKRIALSVYDWVGLIFYALHRAENTQCDYPPDTVYVSWPYNQDLLLDTEYDQENDEVSEDEIYALPERFYWNEHSCATHMHLATLVSCYEFNGSLFYLSDNRQELDETDRFWTDADQNVLRYNYDTKRWNIVDKNEKILYRSARVYSSSVRLSDVGWYDTSGPIINRPTPVESSYMADFHMPLYKGKIHSKDELAEMLHEQAIGFLIMNLEAHSDESAINRAAYHMIINHRCVGGLLEDGVKSIPIKMNFFNGKSYSEYLNQKSTDIINLDVVLERYDMEPDPSVLYSRMADEIIMSLLPDDDPYCPMGAKTSAYRYQKIVKLFKSITAYNLAYIEMQYVDFDSTKMSTDISDYVGYHVVNSITDNWSDNQFEMKTSTVIKTTMKPSYPDQMQVIKFKDTYSEDIDEDLNIKQTILDNIDKILEIYDTKRLSKNRKKTRLVNLLGEDIADIVSTIPYVQLQNIQNAVHVVSKTHISESIKQEIVQNAVHVTVDEPDTTTQPYELLTIPDSEVISNE